MPDRIDYAFLSRLEGGSKTSGYVPAPSVSRSGVTIATGFDLGQRSEVDLRRLNLSSSLIKLLKPYLMLRGVAAQTFLQKHPLAISTTQARMIDQAVKAEHVQLLRQHYDKSASAVRFDDLPAEAQTVIASVSFQYGPRLSIRAPKFWAAVVLQDWSAAVALLRKFGDIYPTRRNKEADLLAALVVQKSVDKPTVQEAFGLKRSEVRP